MLEYKSKVCKPQTNKECLMAKMPSSLLQNTITNDTYINTTATTTTTSNNNNNNNINKYRLPQQQAQFSYQEEKLLCGSTSSSCSGGSASSKEEKKFDLSILNKTNNIVAAIDPTYQRKISLDKTTFDDKLKQRGFIFILFF